MITLTCTKCQTVMEMDDAFAGGVCRCQHCGTIQTVPSNLKRGARPGAPAKAGGQKALYSGGRGSGGSAIPSSGLDDLANAVASSSGLSSGLANRRPTPTSKGGRRGATVDYAKPGTDAGKPNRLPLVVGLVVVGLAVAGAAFWFLLRPTPPAPPTVGGTNTGGPGVINPAGPNDPSIVGPQFVGLPLDYKKVVFVIDRGQAGSESFDPLKAELYKAITALGPQREFQVVFWTATRAEDPDTMAYPKGGTARGNPERVSSLKKHLEDVTTSGSTEVGPAIREAMSRGPDAVVIATAKAGFSLDDSFTKAVDEARAGKSVVVHTVDLTTGGDARAVLEPLAKSAGGKYVHVPPTKLR